MNSFAEFKFSKFSCAGHQNDINTGWMVKIVVSGDGNGRYGTRAPYHFRVIGDIYKLGPKKFAAEGQIFKTRKKAAEHFYLEYVVDFI